MEILFISSLVSKSLVDKLFRETGKNVGFEIQKFHRLLVRGFVKNGIIVKTLTGLPISRSLSNKLWWNLPNESEDGVNYQYISFVNYPVLRHIFLFLYSFFYTLLWGIKGRKDKCIVCDVLNISLCMGSLLASKLIGLRSVGVMTDMPGLMVSKASNVKCEGLRIIPRINKSFLTSFSYYVFLTEQMNEVVNRKHQPYIVMEGLVDELMAYTTLVNVNRGDDRRVLLYAGGLHERYGLKKLVEAFMRVDAADVQLSLYGDGPFVEDLKHYCAQDSRIVYYGVVPNDEVVQAELLATLLINPRPTDEEFTKYSFPSKNMEYMVSGTPVLTTKLPGMPKEYYSYIYLFEDETVEGYTKAMNHILSLPKEELCIKGADAKRFVLECKSNVSQAKRIIDMLSIL